MRIYKFAARRVAPNAYIRYQSFDGYSVEVDGKHVGKLEHIVSKMWAVDLPDHAFYKIVDTGFQDAKALLRAMLAKHYPVAA